MNVASHHLRCTHPMLTQSQVEAVLLYLRLIFFIYFFVNFICAICGGYGYFVLIVLRLCCISWLMMAVSSFIHLCVLYKGMYSAKSICKPITINNFLALSCVLVCPPGSDRVTPTGWIFMKFHIWGFLLKFLDIFWFCLNLDLNNRCLKFMIPCHNWSLKKQLSIHHE